MKLDLFVFSFWYFCTFVFSFFHQGTEQKGFCGRRGISHNPTWQVWYFWLSLISSSFIHISLYWPSIDFCVCAGQRCKPSLTTLKSPEDANIWTDSEPNDASTIPVQLVPSQILRITGGDQCLMWFINILCDISHCGFFYIWALFVMSLLTNAFFLHTSVMFCNTSKSCWHSSYLPKYCKWSMPDYLLRLYYTNCDVYNKCVMIISGWTFDSTS